MAGTRVIGFRVSFAAEQALTRAAEAHRTPRSDLLRIWLEDRLEAEGFLSVDDDPIAEPETPAETPETPAANVPAGQAADAAVAARDAALSAALARQKEKDQQTALRQAANAKPDA